MRANAARRSTGSWAGRRPGAALPGRGGRAARLRAATDRGEPGVVPGRMEGNWVAGDGVAAKAGAPAPLGPSLAGGAVNFAMFSEGASRVVLVLSRVEDSAAANPPTLEFELAKVDDSRGVWAVAVDNLPTTGVLYGYRVWGDGGWNTGYRWDQGERVLLDPHAPLVHGRQAWATRDAVEQFEERVGSLWRGTFDLASDFDWGAGYAKPDVAWEDTVVYEASVRAYTGSPTSKLSNPEAMRGTYLGVAERADHLASLGVTAVELLPVFEFDELEFQRMGPSYPRNHLVNAWGYSHVSFMAPMSRFGTPNCGAPEAARQFKEMVKALHAKGIEVILDVVYNHTVEGGDVDAYHISWRGIDNKAYYMLNFAEYDMMCNYSGCGNSVNANHPMVKQLIIDSLVRWVEEFHVDGFRFDLASVLCRDSSGRPLEDPPLIREISKHPVLKHTKLISEPWDCGGLYLVGKFPNWDIWAEWNGQYRDVVRKFIKGDGGMKKRFATALCGSANLYNYNNRRPYHSVNFVTCHDGFSLRDLVSYNSKHNDANGESGRDGSNDNESWNCGVEGNTGDEAINALRNKQMRNALVALLLSQGTPMLRMGDEYGLSTNGNNNTYGHDNELTWFDWDAKAREDDGLVRFTRMLTHFRRQHPALGRSHFLEDHDITWHETNWDNPESKFLAYTLHAPSGGSSDCSAAAGADATLDDVTKRGDLLVAFNAHHYWVDFAVPPASGGKAWHRVVDTNLESPRDFLPNGKPESLGSGARYNVAPYSALVLVAR